MATPVPSLSVAAIIERVPLANRWASEQWRVVAVERDERPAATIKERDDPACARWRVTGFAIELHRSESEGYFLNISSEQPKAFVMWRTREADGAEGTAPDGALIIVPKRVTVSYNEAGRLLDGGEQVEAVPLPAEIRAWMESFVAEHYKPEPKRKSRRNELYERDAERGEATKTKTST